MTWNNIKITVFVILFCAAVWFYKDYAHQVAENKRLSENARQIRKQDSTRIAELSMSKEELQEYLRYQNPDLERKLQEANIRLGRIESIQSTTLKYRDTSSRSFDMSAVLDAIRQQRPASQVFVDTSECMKITGSVEYTGDSMRVKISDREFKNKSDGVVYWERRQWKLLGIKTRLFGKKQFTAKMFDQCGESKTLRIEKAK